MVYSWHVDCGGCQCKLQRALPLYQMFRCNESCSFKHAIYLIRCRNIPTPLALGSTPCQIPLHCICTPPPPAHTHTQELSLDPGLLVQALVGLPLTDLLGLSVPEEFLREGISWEQPPHSSITTTQSRTQQQLQDATAALSALHVGQAKQQQQQQFQPQMQARHLPPHLQHLQAQQPKQQQQLLHSTPAGPVLGVPPAAAATQASTAAYTPASQAQLPLPPPAAAGAAGQEDDTDELLDLLLSGGAPPPQPPAAAATTAAATAGVQGASAPAAASSVKAAAGASTGLLEVGFLSHVPPPATAVAAAAAPKGAASKPTAAFDDELDALLGFGPPAAAAQQPPAQVCAAGRAPGISNNEGINMRCALCGQSMHFALLHVTLWDSVPSTCTAYSPLGQLSLSWGSQRHHCYWQGVPEPQSSQRLPPPSLATPFYGGCLTADCIMRHPSCCLQGRTKQGASSKKQSLEEWLDGF